jgi:hypothetical protein
MALEAGLPSRLARSFASSGVSVCSQIATLKPGADQFGDVRVAGMDTARRTSGCLRHCVLPRLVSVMSSAAEALNRVVVEQFVEIAHAVEQQRAGVAFLHGA